MWIIPEKEWAESWEETLQREWPHLEMPDTEHRVVGVEVVTTNRWPLTHLPHDQTWRVHPRIEGVTYRRDTTDGRILDQVRFACPYDYRTVVAVVRELVDLGIVPTDRWSLLIASTWEAVDQA